MSGWELQLDLTASTARFKAGFDAATETLKKFGDDAAKHSKASEAALNKIGEAVANIGEKLKHTGELIGVFFAFEKGKQLYESLEGTASAVDKIGKAAGRLGVGVEQLSALKFAAESSGVGFDTLTNLMAKGEQRIAEFVSTGSGSAKRALAEIGVSLLDSTGHIRNMVDLLPDLAKGIGEVQDNAEQLNLSEQIFGKGNGEQFVQLVRELGDNFDQLGEKEGRARQLGVVFTPEQVHNASLYKDSVEQVAAAWFGLKVKVLDVVGPFLQKWHENIATFIAEVPQLVGTLAGKIAAAFGEGPERDEARKQLGDFWESIKNYSIIAVADMSTVLYPYFVKAFFVLGGAAGDSMGAAMVSSAITAISKIGKFAVTGLTNLGVSETIAKALLGPLAIAADQADKLKYVAEAVSDTFSPAGPPSFLLNSEEQAKVDQAWKTMTDDLGTLGDRVSDTTSKLFGYAAMLAKTAEAAKKPIAPDTNSKEWVEFKNGFNDSFKALEIRANDFRGFGASIANEFGTLSDGIAHSLTQTLLHAQNFWQGLKTTFANVGEMVIETALKFITLRAVVAGLAGFGGLFAASPSVGAGLGTSGAPASSLQGAIPISEPPFASGGVFSGSIITRPTLIPMATGGVLGGEKGPEAIVPLANVGGQLGIRSAGGGGNVTVQVIDQRSGGAKPEVTQSTGPDGRKLIQVLIRDEVQRSIASGDMDRVMASNYGLSRSGTRR